MDNLPAFNGNPANSLFETKSKSNGGTYWLESDLMALLGYDNKNTFRNAVSKAQAVCANLNIPVEENFISIKNEKGIKDTQLTRFACYLIAMNADSRKPEVAKAQAYFAALAESFRQYCEEAENVMRLQIRSEISGREKSLSGVAKEAGVIEYHFFQNAGYRGMYNMNLSQIRTLKHVPNDRSPLDFMGKTELAANLFRITQTEAKIKGENIKGQKQCEVAAEHVGKVVRKTMKHLSGQTPESLPPAHDIKEVKKELKETHNKLKRIDANKNNKKTN